MVLGGSSVREKGLLVDLSSSLALRAPEPRCVPELATASGRGLSPFPEPPAPGRCRLSLMLAMPAWASPAPACPQPPAPTCPRPLAPSPWPPAPSPWPPPVPGPHLPPTPGPQPLAPACPRPPPAPGPWPPAPGPRPPAPGPHLSLVPGPPLPPVLHPLWCSHCPSSPPPHLPACSSWWRSSVTYQDDTNQGQRVGGRGAEWLRGARRRGQDVNQEAAPRGPYAHSGGTAGAEGSLGTVSWLRAPPCHPPLPVLWADSPPQCPLTLGGQGLWLAPQK